jgi:hypothetical protein
VTEFDVAWAKPPEGMEILDIPGITVGPDDRVYAFSRGQRAMLVFERDGTFVTSWGEDFFVWPHGVRYGRDGFLYCTDEVDHTVRKCTTDGEVVLTLGTPGRPSEFMSGEPFCRPTNAAPGPDGDIFVSDGYGNSHVHRFTADGEHVLTWGAPGSDAGEFHIPHDVVCDEDGWVYVVDRENSRIQIFDRDGKLHDVWANLHRPAAMVFAGDGGMLIAELGPMFKSAMPWVPNLGVRVTRLDASGRPIDHHGALHAGAAAPDEFIAPHGIAIDSRGDVYVGEVSNANWTFYTGEEPPPGLTTVRRLTIT